MMRIYLFYREDGELVFYVPWNDKEPPFLIECVRPGREEEEGKDDPAGFNVGTDKMTIH
jgi:hypothetical protein